jgi:hypothetical protein
VFVVCNSLIVETTSCNLLTSSSALGFNGDDALVLLRDGTIVDVFGQIGVDPGSSWGSGATVTANATLRRKSAVLAGDAVGTDAFDPAAEWEGFPVDTFSGLGAHTFSGP